MAPLCKFWARGECRNGDGCRFEHPRDLGRSNNRYTVLQAKEDNSRNNLGRNHNDGRSTPPQNASYTLNREAIIADLSTERPQWKLSAYAPAPKAPAQLFGGSTREQSFEEMRLHYYNGVTSGNPALAIQQANALIREAEIQMQNALRDVEGAMNFIRKSENEHPNRVDICQNSTNSTATTGTASTNSLTANNAVLIQPAPGFGQPSTLGAKSNPFGTSNQAFSKPSMPAFSGGFGQSSALEQKLNPFSPPSTETILNQSTSIAPFSAFAGTQTSIGVAPYSTPPNPFGQTTQVSNPFGQPILANQPVVNPFAQAGQPAQPVGNPFTQTMPIQSPFSQTAGLTSSQPSANPFGTTTSSNHFDALSPVAQRNPFAITEQSKQGNPFGHQETPSSRYPFGQPLAPSHELKPSPFALSVPLSQEKVSAGSAQSPYRPNSKFQHPALESYSSRDENQRLVMFRGRPVIYKNGDAGFHSRDGSWEKIWFPLGPPTYYNATELSDEEYTDDTQAAYEYLQATGTFKDGIIPLLPPKREWCLWDF